MADVRQDDATSQSHVHQGTDVHKAQASGETPLSLAVKALFWLVVLPAVLMLAAKWLLQP